MRRSRRAGRPGVKEGSGNDSPDPETSLIWARTNLKGGKTVVTLLKMPIQASLTITAPGRFVNAFHSKGICFRGIDGTILVVEPDVSDHISYGLYDAVVLFEIHLHPWNGTPRAQDKHVVKVVPPRQC